MIELIVSHRRHNIEPATLSAAYKGSSIMSHVREWAVDQLMWDMKQGQREKNGEAWIALVSSVQGFGVDFMTACQDAGRGFHQVVEPYEEGRNYLMVFEFFHKIPRKAHGLRVRYVEFPTQVMAV